MQNINSTIQILLARFNGQVLIPFTEAGKSIGIAGQSSRNMLFKHTFPVPTVLRGSRRYVHISDLAEYVDKLREQSTEKKSRRGRPTKASKMQALRMEEAAGAAS